MKNYNLIEFVEFRVCKQIKDKQEQEFYIKLSKDFESLGEGAYIKTPQELADYFSQMIGANKESQIKKNWHLFLKNNLIKGFIDDMQITVYEAGMRKILTGVARGSKTQNASQVIKLFNELALKSKNNLNSIIHISQFVPNVKTDNKDYPQKDKTFLENNLFKYLKVDNEYDAKAEKAIEKTGKE